MYNATSSRPATLLVEQPFIVDAGNEKVSPETVGAVLKSTAGQLDPEQLNFDFPAA
jgi:Asp-tRNA(Asn)/Glu-tRNA(Gln) amidotransferase B subunit